MKQSRATPEQILNYTEGQCHVLAVALHRAFGWSMELALSPEDPFWSDPADSDNYIEGVVHVYALDEQGNAWDIRGVRPWSAVRAEVEALFSPQSLSLDNCANEQHLATYVGCWGEDAEGDLIERPLEEYDDAAVAQAWAVAQQALAHLPGWPTPAANTGPATSRSRCRA